MTTNAHIIVGVDGSHTSVLALIEGARLAVALNAPLLAVAAWRYPPFFGKPAGAVWSPEADAKDILTQALVDAFDDEIPTLLTAEARRGTPIDVLLHAAADAQLLVVGNRGVGGFSGLRLGSVTAKLSEYANCPVLIIHDDAGIARDSSEPEWTDA
jgi:nucleotide-binding universal stress UspA family protein